MFKEKKAAIITLAILAFIVFVLPMLVFGSRNTPHDGLFSAVRVVLSIAFVITALITIVKAEDPRVSDFIKFLPVLIGVALFIWQMGWMADYKSKKSEAIQNEISR